MPSGIDTIPKCSVEGCDNLSRVSVDVCWAHSDLTPRVIDPADDPESSEGRAIREMALNTPPIELAKKVAELTRELAAAKRDAEDRDYYLDEEA